MYADRIDDQVIGRGPEARLLWNLEDIVALIDARDDRITLNRRVLVGADRGMFRLLLVAINGSTNQ
jgi:hypothetical protein